MTSQFNKTALIVAGMVCATVLVSVQLGVIGLKEVKQSTNDKSTVVIVGKAKKDITADTAKWTVELRRMATTTEELRKEFELDKEAFKKLLENEGITDAKYSFLAEVESDDYYYGDDYYDGNYSAKSSRKSIRQQIVIESSNVAKLGNLNEKGSRLAVRSGASIQSLSILFTYSKADELKSELTKQALVDAKAQAKELFGHKLGDIQMAQASIFSLASRGENDTYNYYQHDDKTSIEKAATVTLTVTFRIK